jgi:hypothetical protein
MKICYASILGGCSGGITGEHYISRSVLELISHNDAAPGIAVVSGHRWKNKALPIASMVANILCRTHNEALSPLDSAAKSLLEGIQHIHSGAKSHAIVTISLNGDFFERWLLKVLCGFMASGNSFSKEGQSVPQQPSREFVRFLFGDDPLPAGFGFYFLSEGPPPVAPHTHNFGFAALSRNGEHTGFLMSVANVQFLLAMKNPGSTPDGLLRGSFYRPRFIKFANSLNGNACQINLHWSRPGSDLGITLRFTPEATPS